VIAGEPDERLEPDDPMPPNVESPTFGGWQLWGDELVFHGWRIQRHVNTGHYRLLDELNLRHAWGTFEQCRAKLEEIKAAKKLAPMKGRVVLLMHGMLRTRSSMNKLSTALEGTGLYEPVQVGYPSTRVGVGYNARALASILNGLGPEVTEIDLVGHSLGNLVIRHYYGDMFEQVDGPGPDPRIKRIVMLGPPNHPPQRAKLWTDHSTFRGLYHFALPGTGHQLSDGFSELEQKLATPTCEFGILAGGKGDGKGWHPMLPGDDDTTVTVAETRLAGARDFAVLPVMHTFLMTDSKTVECTLRFLETGYFFGEALRQPIPALPATIPALPLTIQNGE
jgi:pimeloyl-ACP methyl ester carboxylesterase